MAESYQQQIERENESGADDFECWLNEINNNPSYAAQEVLRIGRTLEIELNLAFDRTKSKPF